MTPTTPFDDSLCSTVQQVSQLSLTDEHEAPQANDISKAMPAAEVPTFDPASTTTQAMHDEYASDQWSNHMELIAQQECFDHEDRDPMTMAAPSPEEEGHYAGDDMPSEMYLIYEACKFWNFEFEEYPLFRWVNFYNGVIDVEMSEPQFPTTDDIYQIEKHKHDWLCWKELQRDAASAIDALMVCVPPCKRNAVIKKAKRYTPSELFEAVGKVCGA